MDRYGDVDLECDGGGAAQRSSIFAGMFKRSSKSAEPSVQAQDSLSDNGGLSKSNDSLTDNSTKEKGGVFKAMFMKTSKSGKEGQPQDNISVQHPELSVSSCRLTDDNKSSKDEVDGSSRVFQERLDSKLTAGADSPSENTANKDGLSAPGEPSGSDDGLSVNSSTKVKGGIFSSVFRKKGAKSQSQDGLPGDGELSASGSLTEKSSKNAVGATMKSTFHTDEQEKNSDSDCEETLDAAEGQPRHKQSKLAGSMTKLIPFPAASKFQDQSGSVDEDPAASSETSSGNKQEKTGTTSTCDKVKPKAAEDNPDYKDMISRDKKAKPAETPVIPARPSEEELNRAARRRPQKQKSEHQAPADDEGLKEDDDSSFKEGKKDEDKDKTEEAKVKKPKRPNPFMPQIKGKVIQKHGAAGNTEEDEGGNRSLFDKLEDFCIDSAQPENKQDVETLMEWWDTVESWEDTAQDDDMTEKEEAKAFAVTADKVQKGIRVFNKLFSERAEGLWQHVIDLNSISDGLDKFNKNTKIAQITGGSTSAIGGVATITGLALAPVTMGISLIVTAVGLGVATAGGLTSAGASISNQVNNQMDRKKVEKIVQDYQEKMADLNKCLTFIKQGIENLKKFDLIKMKKNAYNQDFPVLSSSFYEDSAMAGKAILINANEIIRVVQIANVAGSTAARAVQIASMATGVLTGLFVGMDIYFVAKDSKELKKGAKSEFAAKIREVATQLHDGLVELNGIRGELQSTSPGSNARKYTAASDSNKKERDGKHDRSDEDSIDCIKKDIENQGFV